MPGELHAAGPETPMSGGKGVQGLSGFRNECGPHGTTRNSGGVCHFRQRLVKQLACA